jgi:glycosyltransferase involved in cell wall biosynthesis|tara:strand:+ start:277 stop:1281 length:1005 start_codon:yes stop_codon:yes gene_type:complete
MPQHRLSICIPTFNRGVYLDKLLNSISQVNPNALNQIEVCISDNNSTDKTSKVIEKWSNILQINQSKNTSNIGALRNLIKVIKKANGDYLLILGDDDEVIPKEISVFLNQLKKNEITPDWFFYGAKDQKGNPLFNFEEIKKFSEKQNLFKSLLKFNLSYFGFIGHHIFSREKVISNINEINFDSQSYPHLTLLMNQPLNMKWMDKYISIKCGQLEWDPFTSYFVLLSYLLSIDNSHFNYFKKSVLFFKYAFSFIILKYSFLASMSPNYSNEVMSTKIKKLKNNSLSLTLRTLFLFHEFLLITLTIIPLNLKKAFVNYDLYEIKNKENEGFNRKL